MIVDTVKIYLRSGRGGEGNVSFFRVSSAKLKGSGGDGGKGGDIIIRVSPHLYDLSKFKGTKKFIALNGANGRENNKKGKDAQDLIVNVPLGTRVLKDNELIADLNRQGSETLVCQGGRPGKGNHKRKQTLPPENGEEKSVILDYRVPNDVAILGFANSGKTTLFNVLTGQDRKVADYPFTTNSCFWAKSEREFKEFMVLDTPPFKKSKEDLELPENVFLRHIFRSKILLLLSDDEDSFDKDFEHLKKEISLFDSTLLEGKKIFHLLTKVGTIDKKMVDRSTLRVAAKENKGIEALKVKIIKELGI